ncbi:MAG: hypothetical protein WA705_03745 [Candidatus Ozemobacteraceae bacterium]
MRLSRNGLENGFKDYAKILVDLIYQDICVLDGLKDNTEELKVVEHLMSLIAQAVGHGDKARDWESFAKSIASVKHFLLHQDYTSANLFERDAKAYFRPFYKGLLGKEPVYPN